jgi:four helix bundle protein
MTADELKFWTKRYSLWIIDLVEKLPNTMVTKVVGNQLIRSGTSVGANYRAACRARSNKEFIAKMTIVAEESDETLFWLELIIEKRWTGSAWAEHIWHEGNELTAIFVSSLKTIKQKVKGSQNNLKS